VDYSYIRGQSWEEEDKAEVQRLLNLFIRKLVRTVHNAVQKSAISEWCYTFTRWNPFLLLLHHHRDLKCATSVVLHKTESQSVGIDHSLVLQVPSQLHLFLSCTSNGSMDTYN